MATIVPNEFAPADLSSVSLANAELDSLPYETDDAETLANAEAHPWLTVERPEVDEASYSAVSLHVAPEDDPLSSRHESAASVNDPEAVREVEEAKAQERASVAIEAGLDQSESEFVGKVAVTTAAADEQDVDVSVPTPTDDAPSAPDQFNFDSGENA